MFSFLFFFSELFPKATADSDPYEAAKNAHALIVLTEWDEFKSYDYNKIFASMLRPAFIFDGRNILDHEGLTKIGFQVPMETNPSHKPHIYITAMFVFLKTKFLF